MINGFQVVFEPINRNLTLYFVNLLLLLLHAAVSTFFSESLQVDCFYTASLRTIVL